MLLYIFLLLLDHKSNSAYCQTPSAPIISATPQTTTIFLNWTQPPGDVIDSFNLLYTGKTLQCVGEFEFSSSNYGSISGINGSMRSHTLTNLEEDSDYNITVTAINGIGSAMSSVYSNTLATAPSVPPVVRVTSATPTTISIAWDEIPCLMRNGMIFRYVVSFCHASIIKCQSLTSVASVSREFSFDHLILRSSYNIAIRADSLDPVLHTPHLGPFSSTITADTSSPQDIGFFLHGVIYPPNVVLDLTDIGVDGDSLRCFTPLIPCCRGSDNPNGGAQGSWRYPNGTYVSSRYHSGNDISRTRGSSSVFLHRTNNIITPIGVYTCEIPDNSTVLREINVYLFRPPLLGLYFKWNSAIYCNGDSFLMSNIGSQPGYRGDPGSTLVCVTTNVNTACCRRSDDPHYLTNGGAIGEWYHPNGTLVPRGNSGKIINFARFGYNHHIRLARIVSNPTPPLGVYTCEVPDPCGNLFTATISLTEQVSTTAASCSNTTSLTSSTPELRDATSGPVTTSMTTGSEMNSSSTDTRLIPVTQTPMSFPPPAVSLTDAGVIVMVGSEIILNCSTDVMSSFVWSHSSISNLSSAARVATSQDSSGVFSVLTISSVLISHAGIYCCKASAAGAFSTRSSVLAVQLTPPILAAVTYPPTIIGSPLTLTCSVGVAAMLEPRVQVQVQWTDSGGVSVAKSVATMRSNTSYTSRLTLANTEESHVGANYTCTASLVSTLAFIDPSDPVSNCTTIMLQNNIEAGHYKAKSFKDCSEGGAVRKAITREVFNLLLSEFGVRSYGKRSSYAAASCSEIHSLYPDYVSDNYWIIGSDGTPALEYCSF